MKVTLHMIYSKLFLDEEFDEFSGHTFDNKKSVKGVRLLPKSMIAFDYDILYVCSDDHPIIKDGVPDSLMLFCIGESLETNFDDENHFFLKSEEELAIVLNKTQEVFRFFNDWDNKLDRITIQGEGLQKIVDASEYIIDNPIVIYDPSLKILVHTKNIKAEDKLYKSAIEKGYLPAEVVEQLEDDREFFKQSKDGFSQNQPDSIRGYNDYIRALKHNDEVLGYCALILIDASNYEYTKSLFDYFCDCVNSYINVHKDSSQFQTYMNDYFLIDLLENKELDINAIKERMKYMKMEYESNYVLLRFVYNNEESAPLKYVAENIFRLIPDANVFTYRGEILALIEIKDEVDGEIKGVINELKPEVVARRMRCGISKPFSTIDCINTAYIQTEQALKFGKDEHFSHYIDYVIEHVISLCEEVVPLDSLCEPVIFDILKGNTKGHVDQLKILDAYLSAGKQLTPAAEMLHMHRNNVAYHIKQMEEKYNLNLDDSRVLFKIVLSIFILEYIEAE